ncbi:MAG TPA: DUF4350 domain-containing protein [Allosphingosinicella sp.]|nr:DUF4350 domain-containing protein [Allosphingosinicella sp.]
MSGRGRRLLKRVLAALAGAIALGIGALLLIPFGQRVDPDYRPAVAAPRWAAAFPAVCFDEGHWNAHTAGGRYRPLAGLLRADGYEVRRHRGRFSAGSLAGCRILVVANAAGGDRFKIGPINLPIKRGGERGDPAFTAGEIALLRSWVARGGALLLVADHAPFGEAARALAAAFVVGMGGGFVEVPRGSPAQSGAELQFTRANGLLRPHPITAGLSRVVTFTGQSLTGAGEPLLLLPPDAVEYVPPGPTLRPVAAGGHRQAVALAFGAGRVAVLGEAGMLTAQIDDGGGKMGMNVPGNDNEAFARNLFHWLARGR